MPPADDDKFELEVALDDEPPKPKNRGGRPKKVVAPAPEAASPVVEAKAPVEDESGLLTKDEIATLRKQAREEALEEIRAAARKKVKARFFKEERGKLNPQLAEEQVTFRLDLPDFADRMIIDSKIYVHGHIYTVARSRYDVFAEQMFRAVDHENTKDGKNRNDLARRLWREQHSGTVINAATGAVANAPARAA